MGDYLLKLDSLSAPKIRENKSYIIKQIKQIKNGDQTLAKQFLKTLKECY